MRLRRTYRRASSSCSPMPQEYPGGCSFVRILLRAFRPRSGVQSFSDLQPKGPSFPAFSYQPAATNAALARAVIPPARRTTLSRSASTRRASRTVTTGYSALRTETIPAAPPVVANATQTLAPVSNAPIARTTGPSRPGRRRDVEVSAAQSPPRHLQRPSGESARDRGTSRLRPAPRARRPQDRPPVRSPVRLALRAVARRSLRESRRHPKGRRRRAPEALPPS